MPVLGMSGTGRFSADERPKNYRDVLLLNKPNTNAPLTAMLGRLRNEMTDDPEFKIFGKSLPAQRAVVSGAQTTGETVIELQTTAHNTLFKPGHAVIVESTQEVVWVTGSSTAGQITVSRGKGSTPATIPAGDGLLILGSHYAEGAPLPTAVSYEPLLTSNYTQIFREVVDLTNTALATRLRYADNSEVEMKREALELHYTQAEKQFLFGSGVEETSASGQPERTTKGCYFFVTTNVTDFADAVDIDTWHLALEAFFADGSNEKVVLGGNRLITTLNKAAMAHGQINLVPSGETFGFRLQSYETPYGTLMLKQHPLLSKNATFKDWGFGLDPAYLVYRYLRGRDTKYLTERQSPGDDAKKSEYLTEAGLELQFEENHAVFKNMSSFVA